VSVDRPSVAGPILFWGIAAGMVSSLVCCFWPATLGAAWFAVRGARRDHDLGAGAGIGIGLGTGVVAGLLVATFGTALMLAQSSPEQMAMLDDLGLAAEVPSMGLIATGHAFVGFGAALTFGLIGGAMGGGGPAPRRDRPEPPRRAPSPPPTRVAAPEPEAVPEPEATPTPPHDAPLDLESEPGLDREGDAWAEEASEGENGDEEEGVDTV